MKHITTNFFLLFIMAIFPACSVGETGSSVLSQTFKGTRMLSEGVSRIYIVVIQNENISSSVKDAFISSLKSRINLNKNLSVVDAPENSDIILKIQLTVFSSESLKFNSSGIAEEKKLRLDSYVWILSASTGEEKIRQKKVESWQIYSEINSPIMSEYKAITGLTDQLAERIVSVATTGWYLETIR